MGRQSLDSSMKQLFRAMGVLAVAVYLGCASSAPAPIEKKMMVDPSPAPIQASASGPKDAQPVVQYVVQLDVYQLSVPQGTVSNNDAFWKRVSEDTIDIATRDVLYLNGIRVGQAPVSEWEYFKNIINENPAVAQQNSYIATQMKSVEMPMRKGITSQCIFVCDPLRESSGRSYDECDNFLTLSFWPAPRKQGDLRVKLCPMVRSVRKKLGTALLDGQREFQYVSPERLYDLKLAADIPLGTFLVIAPSEYAKAPTSVGNAFLMKDGPADREEQVLILVPRVYGTKSIVNSERAGVAGTR
jgi:hypothetical protein